MGERGRKEEGKKQEIKDEWGKMEGGSGGKEQRRTVIKERWKKGGKNQKWK